MSQPSSNSVYCSTKISFCGICSAIGAAPDFRCAFPTAVASVVLHTPILKHVLGIFGLTDASKENVRKILKKPGVEGSIVLYVGGMAELFFSSRKRERLFLSKRKGFIKLALVEGVDIVPVYLFGNTSVLTVVKTGLLAKLSRRLQVSLTYFWGKYSLPIPRDDKVRTWTQLLNNHLQGSNYFACHLEICRWP